MELIQHDVVNNDQDIGEERQHSRLSRTLHDLLRDRDAQPYFLQYMSARQALPLVKFWLEAEYFRLALCEHSDDVSENGGKSCSRQADCDTLNQKSSCDASSIGAHGQTESSRDECSLQTLNSSQTVETSLNYTDACDAGKTARTAEVPVSIPSVSQLPSVASRVSYKHSIQKDAVAIYSKYISPDGPQFIDFGPDLRDYCIEKICSESGEIQPHCFIHCQQHVVELMEKEYYPGYLSSDTFVKYKIDILTGPRVLLSDILYNECAMFYFMEFAEQEKVLPYLLCWISVDNFQRQLQDDGKLNGNDLTQNDAMVIYDKYFSLQAHTPLGFSEKIRFEVENRICEESGPSLHCFSAPKAILYRTMHDNLLPKFLQSEVFFKYLSHLIGEVKSNTFPKTESDAKSHKRKKSSNSDFPDANSAQGDLNRPKNTLLASGHSTILETTPWDSDLDDIFNPKSIWQREHSGALSLGKVNQLGQFKSELLPEPEADKKSFLWKRKSDHLKNQEEFALRFADMVINDVTATTLGDSLNTDS